MEKSTIFLMFPGQGSYYPGMAKYLLSRYPLARKHFERVQYLTGIDVHFLCTDCTKIQLQNTIESQLAIFTTSAACWDMLVGEVPNILRKKMSMAGHSLGEYAMLYASGVLGFDEATKAVYIRSKLMDKICKKYSGAMLAVFNVPLEILEELCSKIPLQYFVGIANDNYPGQIVVSGLNDGLRKLQALLQETSPKAKTIALDVDGPFHSYILGSIQGRFKESLEEYKWQVGHENISLFSNVTGEIVNKHSPCAWKMLLTENLTSRVKWRDIMYKSLQFPLDYAIECSTTNLLTKIFNKFSNEVPVYNFSDIESFDNLILNLKRVKLSR